MDAYEFTRKSRNLFFHLTTKIKNGDVVLNENEQNEIKRLSAEHVDLTPPTVVEMGAN